MFAAAVCSFRTGRALLHPHSALVQVQGRTACCRQCRETLLVQPRAQSTWPDFPSDAPFSPSSTPGETVSIKDDSLSSTGWKMRKRLHQLSTRLAPSKGAKVSRVGEKPRRGYWKEPSKPRKSREEMRSRAEDRWTDLAEKVAERSTISSSREQLRERSRKSKARNVEGTEAELEAQKVIGSAMTETGLKNSDHSGNESQSKAGEEERSSSLVSGKKAKKKEKREEDLAKQAMAKARANAEHVRSWNEVLNALDPQEAEEVAVDEAEAEEATEAEGSRGAFEKPDRQKKDVPPHLTVEYSNAAAQSRPRGASGPSSSIRQTEMIKGPALQQYRRVKVMEGGMTEGRAGEVPYLPFEAVPTMADEKRDWWDEEGKWKTSVGGKMSADSIAVDRVDPLREMNVPRLAHGLDRVLFNPGVHWLRDARSGIYNFDPRIRNLYDVDLFDYSALPPYMTSSADPELAELVRRTSKRYSGSTSSMTALLSQIYFLISAWKQPDLSNFSSGYDNLPRTYSFGARLPASILLRRFEEQVEGKTQVRYAIDADKGNEGDENSNYVLLQLGKSLEKMLTSDIEDYEKYLRINSHTLDPEEKLKKEAYHYASTNKILMRSQLDCYDERLPRKTFDLKTRAVIAVRQDRANWAESSGYMIRHASGVFESFEREMFDMTRSALLKYFFQARIGNMDGIMVAYHSTATMYGFQYLSCEDMAQKLFSSVEMGEQAFKLSLGMLERILDAVTDIKPDHSLRITMDTELSQNPKMLVFAKPDGADKEQNGEEEQQSREKELLQLDVVVDRYLHQSLVQGPVDFSIPPGYSVNLASEDEISRRSRADLPPMNWSLEYSISPRSDLSEAMAVSNLAKVKSRTDQLAALVFPNLQALNERERMRESELSKNESALQKYYGERRVGGPRVMPLVPGQEIAGERLLGMGTSDGEDVAAARADLSESVEQAEGSPPSQQQWRKAPASIDRLRELARLGREDKERQDSTDRLQVYQRRDE